MSRRIVTSVRAAMIGSLTPSTQTLVRWPSPRASPTSGSKAKIRSDRANLPKPSETIRGSDATRRSCQPASRHVTRDSHLPRPRPGARRVVSQHRRHNDPYVGAARGRFTAQPAKRSQQRMVARVQFFRTRNETPLGSVTVMAFLITTIRGRPARHADSRGTSAVSRALIITSDHICHMLHSINSGQEST